jgi:predicted naringenin-chalcone synthase
MSCTILGMGTALPSFSIGQQESAEYAALFTGATEYEKRRLPVLYRMSGVHTRHSVLLDGPQGAEVRQSFFPEPVDAADEGPTIGVRMGRYEVDAPRLAIAASREALERAEVLPSQITHLVTVSCSGFAAPGVDITLIKGLGLGAETQRVHVGFMGCHGALNGLRVVNGITATDPNATVLMCCVELCSIHYHYGYHPEQVVANALFADGAGALVAGGGGHDDNAWRILDTGSCLIPDSEDAMTWRIRDHGFEMTLSAAVPDLIASNLRGWVDGWLARHGMTVDDIASWAIHPGGPRILGAAGKALGLENGSLEASKYILQNFGNMSSPTVLFILDRLRGQQARTPCLALAFGPGLMAEGVLFA